MTDPAFPISGHCAPEFSAVAKAFEENFARRDERGAAVCVYRDGQPVVDLWGGWRNPARTLPWEKDTIVCMMSVGKGVAALCVWMLIDRGRIDLDAPVARYWPSFAGGGKGAITVRTLLSAKAGLLYADHAPDGSAFDWDVVIAALERQEPCWEPGADHGYHSATAGYLLGELVHQVDGRTIDRFLREEITTPLGIDYGYGAGWAAPERVADVIPNTDSHTFVQTRDPSTKLGRAWRIRPVMADHYNDAGFRGAMMPSSNGHGNARAIARLFAVLANGGTLDGTTLVSPSTIDRMREQSWDGTCAMTDRQFRYAHGFFLNKEDVSPMGTNPRAFGHPGAGGALGFADPENRISFAYSPTLMCAGGGVGDRCAALVAAVYQ